MKIWIVCSFALLVIFTNRWMGWEEGINYMYVQDVPTYVKMAEAVPGFYVQPPIAAHFAQRFFSSYLAGGLSQISHLSIPLSFCILTGLSLILTLFFFHLILEAIGLGIFSYTLTMAFFIFNPYFFRFYMLVPGNLNVPLCICAMAAMILGLLKRNMALILVAGVVGILSRQSMLLLLPSVLWWVLAAESWKVVPVQRRCIFLGTLIVVIYAVFCWIGYIAGLMTPLPLVTAACLSGIFPWVAQYGFQWKVIGELVLRSFMPHVFAVVFMVGILLKRPLSMQRNMVEFFSCLLVMMLISLQPILAGPAVTGYPKGSGTRLGAMGIVAIMTALAMVMKHCDLERIFKENRIFWIASIVILAFNSFHHLYSWVLPFSMERFILFNFISAFAIGAMWFKVITVKPA